MIGQTFGHYIVLEKLGAGGMGEVYRAHDQHLERDVALKVLPAGFLAHEAARKRFRGEALALSKLNHPNIATVFDFDSHGDVDFLAMELIHGTPLSDQLKAGALSTILRDWILLRVPHTPKLHGSCLPASLKSSERPIACPIESNSKNNPSIISARILLISSWTSA